MRTGLRGDAHAAFLGGGDLVDRAGVRQVKDVGTAAGLLGGGDDGGDGLRLRGRRAGRQEAVEGLVDPTGRIHVRGGLVDDVAVLGVDDDQAVELGDLGHGLVQLLGGERRELVDTGVQQEALEAEDATVPQSLQVTGAEVLRHGPAPETHVDLHLLLRHGLLRVEGVDGDGGGDGVQGHVEQGRDTAGRRGAGDGGEALPLGASRLVDVDVGVHQAGDEDLVGGDVDDLGVVPGVDVGGQSRGDGDDGLAVDDDRDGAEDGSGAGFGVLREVDGLFSAEDSGAHDAFLLCLRSSTAVR